MTIAMKNVLALTLILASTSVVLSNPIPASRRASGILIKYTDNYPPELPVAAEANESLPSLTVDDLEELLAADSPLPSAFLMALPSLHAAAKVASAEPTQTPTWDRATVQLQQALADAVTRSMFLALAGFAGCFIALIACAIQRWRNGTATGVIYLIVDKPSRRNHPSICADHVEEAYTDEKQPAESSPA